MGYDFEPVWPLIGERYSALLGVGRSETSQYLDGCTPDRERAPTLRFRTPEDTS